MKFLFLLLGTAASLDHLLSFNWQCDAVFNLLAGTPAEAALSPNRIPAQFLRSLQRVVQSRVAARPGCSSFAVLESTYPGSTLYSKLFGMEAINFIRFLDSADTTASSANWPGSCNGSEFSFNWKEIRTHFAGINLPSSCSAATFATQDCKAKFELIPGFDIEIWIKDTCTSLAQSGYHLPQVQLRCSGNMCNTFGLPCLQDSDCGTGVHCDAIANSNLDNATQFLNDIGLFNTTYDSAGCPASGGIDFTQNFFSKIINNVANLLGFTTNGPDTKQYTQVSLCGIRTFADKYFPTTAPTPSVFFVCQNGTHLSPNAMCNGVQDCQFNEDEQNCGCGMGGGYFQSYCGGQCCQVCDSNNNCCGSAAQGGQYCSNPAPSGPQICTQDSVTNVLTCPDLYASSGVSTPVTYPPLASVPSDDTNHVMLWADCLGNVQIGNANDIGVVNFFHPFHQIAARLESIISSTQGCRAMATATNDYFRRQFYLWGVTFFGGLFLDTLSATTSYNAQTPGAKLDDQFRWFASINQQNCVTVGNCSQGCSTQCSYNHTPPFPNLGNPWSTCNLNTITGPHTCQINAQVQSVFANGFPSSWGTVTTTLQAAILSNCNTALPFNNGMYSDNALPQVYLTCNGICDPTGPKSTDSACCMMRRPLIVLGAGNSCPQGYTSQSITSSISDFIFINNLTMNTNDTTLINFLQLLASKTIDFGTHPSFVDPSVGSPPNICVINGSALGNNLNTWGQSVYTEDCPVGNPNPSNGQGCPQILSNGPAVACGGSSLPCQTPPSGNSCPPTGCPNGPPAPVCAPGDVCSTGYWMAPTLFAAVLPLVL